MSFDPYTAFPCTGLSQKPESACPSQSQSSCSFDPYSVFLCPSPQTTNNPADVNAPSSHKQSSNPLPPTQLGSTFDPYSWIWPDISHAPTPTSESSCRFSPASSESSAQLHGILDEVAQHDSDIEDEYVDACKRTSKTKEGRPSESAGSARRPSRAQLKQQMLSGEHIAAVQDTVCCPLRCLSVVGKESIVNGIASTFELGQKEAGLKMFSELFQCHRWDDSNKLQFDFKFGRITYVMSASSGKPVRSLKRMSVCEKAWLMGNGYGDRQFRRFKRQIAQGYSEYYMSQADKGLRSVNFERKPLWAMVVGWLLECAQSIGDCMPDKVEVRLPWPTHKETYATFVAEMSTKHPGQHLPTYWYFMCAWRSDCSHIVVSKPHSKFATCTECAQITEHLLSPDTTDQQKRELQEQRRKHLLKQKSERAQYYIVRELSLSHAKTLPDGRRCLSIIMDAMDQLKNYMPHFRHKNKFESSATLLKQCVMGVIVHGFRRFIFAAHEYLPFGPNLTIECLHRTLQFVFASVGSTPPVLFLQLDNCYKDNKNRYVFAYCAWLIHSDLFEEVQVSFLIVGHTHEDIDQMFSIIARYLGVHDAATLAKWRDAVREAFQEEANKPQVEFVQGVRDFKQWLEQHIDPELAYHTEPHSFRFRKRMDGQIEMHYKMLRVHTTWLPSDPADGVIILPTVPEGEAPVLAVSQDWVNLKKNKVQKDVDRLLSSHMSRGLHTNKDQELRDAQSEWARWFDMTIDSNRDTGCVWSIAQRNQEHRDERVGGADDISAGEEDEKLIEEGVVEEETEEEENEEEEEDDEEIVISRRRRRVVEDEEDTENQVVTHARFTKRQKREKEREKREKEEAQKRKKGKISKGDFVVVLSSAVRLPEGREAKLLVTICRALAVCRAGDANVRVRVYQAAGRAVSANSQWCEVSEWETTVSRSDVLVVGPPKLMLKAVNNNNRGQHTCKLAASAMRLLGCEDRSPYVYLPTVGLHPRD